MAKLICAKCDSTMRVPQVHEGPGVVSKKDPSKLTCSTHGEMCGTMAIPQCCGGPMGYAS